MELHPEILTRDGKPEFAVIPYDEFLKVQEMIEDLEDLADLQAAGALSQEGIPFEVARADLEKLP